MKSIAPTPFRHAACAVALLAATLGSTSVAALELRPRSVHLAAGGGSDEVASLTVGLGWDTAWRRSWLGGELGVTLELFLSQWRARAVGGGRESFTQVGLLPLLRYRFDGGRSPWYLEAGIGATLMDGKYRTPDKQFSTSGNFIDVLGVGRNLGSDGRREIGLRYAHISNADIKKPNPGEDFLQLRYAIRF